MGEKIRDIKEIQIGRSRLMVELNEGYSANQGRLIHIQNSKFRYLLTEYDFYHLSTLILRAWSEFEYLKNKKIDKEIEVNVMNDLSEPKKETLLFLNKLAEHFNATNLAYRVLDIQKECIIVLIKEDYLQKAEIELMKVGIRKTKHPFGKDNNYKFLYQMHPFLRYENEFVCVDIFCQLPCGSIMPKTWIPLDRMIQSHIWSEEESVNGIQWCNKLVRYIFLLCWAIFTEKRFSDRIKHYLKDNKMVLDNPIANDLFSVVFFRYTPVLIMQLRMDKYDDIIPNYFHFLDY